MNLRINPFAHNALINLKENILLSVSPQQKKIALVVAVIFSTFAALYFFSKCLWNSKGVGPKKDAEPKQDVSPKQDVEPKQVIEPEQKDILPLTVEQQIAVLNSSQIDALAKKVITKVMSRLKIDVEYKPLNGETYPDTSGNRHPVFWEQYDPSSKFMAALLPIVAGKIRQSFEHPAQFIDTGIEFCFIGTDNGLVSHGIVTTISDAYLERRISDWTKLTISNWKLNNLDFSMSLSLNKKYTDDKSELYFDIHTKFNGANLGHDGGTLKAIEKSAIQFTV